MKTWTKSFFCILLALLPALALAQSRWTEAEQAAQRDPAQFIRDAELALEKARAANDAQAEMVALRMLLMSRKKIAEPKVVPEYVERGLALARAASDPDALSYFLSERAILAGLDGNQEQRSAALDEALSLAVRHGMTNRIVAVQSLKGRQLQEQGRYAEALDWYMKAYGNLAAMDTDRLRIQLLVNVADIHTSRVSNAEDRDKGIDFYKQALQLSLASANLPSAGMIYRNLGSAYLQKKQYDEARKMLEQAVAIHTELRSTNLHVDQLYLGHLAMEERRLADALSFYDQARTYTRNGADGRRLRLYALVGRAKAAAELDRKEEAIAALQAARAEAANAEDQHYLVSHGHEIHARLGDYKQAYAEFTRQREAEFKANEELHLKEVDELKVRFDVRLKDADNAALRAQQKESEANRLVTLLAFTLAVVLLGGLAFYLRRRAAAAQDESRHHQALAAAQSAANQAKTTFLANMSHELRSPLNAMLGFTRLLSRDSRLPRDAKDDLGIVLKSGEHLYALINQVLDLSKIEAGRVVLDEKDFDVDELIDGLEDTFSLSAAQKGVRLGLDSAPDVPRFARADAVKLRQVLINLLSNAIKFTQEGSVDLRVSVRDGENGPRLAFAVSDTGVGIAQEELRELGKAFIQARAGREASEGTGLGLAISRNFVELMHGTLSLSSEPGVGTTVSFDIPLVQAIDQSPAAHVEQGRIVMALAPHQPEFRILAVDDRPEGRQLLIRLLSTLGFAVREAGNGQEALEIWEEWKPHLIFMDMRMPVMDGRDATRRIRTAEHDRRTIIVALTASSFDSQREAIIADGCDDFMRKPFREEALLETIRKHLGVEYVYADDTGTVNDTVAERAPLPALPDTLRQPLMTALEALDVEAIDRAIDAIRDHDAATAARLEDMAASFDYARMRVALDGAAGL